MYRSAYSLEGYSIGCVDGECGKVSDFLFDDHQHSVRYIVAETGNWFLGREVLISPVAVEKAEYDDKTLVTSLSQQAVKQSPGIETDRPVSRQNEIELVVYYNWPMYWSQPGMGAPVSVPRGDIGTATQVDATLRSFNEVRSYTIQCIDRRRGVIIKRSISDSR